MLRAGSCYGDIANFQHYHQNKLLVAKVECVLGKTVSDLSKTPTKDKVALEHKVSRTKITQIFPAEHLPFSVPSLRVIMRYGAIKDSQKAALLKNLSAMTQCPYRRLYDAKILNRVFPKSNSTYEGFKISVILKEKPKGKKSRDSRNGKEIRYSIQLDPYASDLSYHTCHKKRNPSTGKGTDICPVSTQYCHSTTLT